MTLQRAQNVFRLTMQAAREGKHLTAYDKEQLRKAQAVLRAHRKPAMNARKKISLNSIQPNPVTSKKNPKYVLIYRNVERIYATKNQEHICDAECKKNGHRYFHDFTSKPRMYGLPNGDLLITSRKH